MGADTVTVRPSSGGTAAPLLARARAAPLFQWLADLGHADLFTFPRSVGFGLARMDAVRGDGCGKKDFEASARRGRGV